MCFLIFHQPSRRTLFRERALACILTIYSRDSRESFAAWILIMVSFCSECKEEAGPPVKDFLSPLSRSCAFPSTSPLLLRPSLFSYFTHTESPSFLRALLAAFVAADLRRQ